MPGDGEQQAAPVARGLARRARYAPILLVLFAAAGAVYGWHRIRAAGRDARDIRGSGIVEVTEVDVSFQVPGTIAELLVDEGNLVGRGQLLARLDEREYAMLAGRAHAACDATESRLALLVKGPRGEEINQALAAAEAARSDLALAETEFARATALREDGVLSQAEFDRIRNARAAAVARRDQTALALTMLKEGTRTEEIEEARALAREAAKAVEVADLNLARCRLEAPIGGRVLSKNFEAGETVQPGMGVFTLGDLDRPWVNIYVSETDLGRVRLGDQASVTIDAFPEEPFPGSVTFIAEKAEFTPKNIQTQQERVKLVYRVKVALENRDQALKPGMPADVVLEAGLAADADRPRTARSREALPR